MLTFNRKARRKPGLSVARPLESAGRNELRQLKEPLIEPVH
jgi:hypothetical protein